MSTELDEAREALAEAGDTDMDNMGHLRAALAEVDRLTAALAEAEATIANERGEGEPPHPSFKWDVGAGYEGAWQSIVIRDAEGWPVSVRRCLPTRWTFDGGRTSHPSARAAMRAATLKETP